MKGENLTYWKWILNQREKDLELEVNRELADDNLIKLIKSEIEEAKIKIEELSAYNTKNRTIKYQNHCRCRYE